MPCAYGRLQPCKLSLKWRESRHRPCHLSSRHSTAQSPYCRWGLCSSVLRGLSLAFKILQLEGVVLPPACTGAYPFASQLAVMTTGLILEGIVLVAYLSRNCLVKHGRPFALLSLIGRVALTGAVVLYPTALSDAVGLLTCESASVSASAAQLLDGGSRMSGSSSNGLVTLSILSSNPYFVCWAGT